MADDDHRYRNNPPPVGRGADPYRDGPGDDPLAELARLIGQNDPFADFGQPAQQRQPYQAAPAREPRRAAEPRPLPEPPRYAAEPPPQDWPDERAYREPSPDPIPAAETPRRRPLSNIFPAQDPLRNLAARPPAEPAAPAYPAHDEFEDAPPRFMARPRTQPAAPPPYAAAAPAAGHDDAGFVGIPPANSPFEDRQYQPEPQYPALEEEDYDDPPQGRRRGGLVLVVAILGLAVVGTAGAFAFRSMFVDGKSGNGSRVILADNRPTKVVPETSGNETGSTKTIYDRIGDRSQTERVVPRQEQPVDVKEPSQSAYPRVVFPGAPNIPVQTAPVAAPTAEVAETNGRPTRGLSTAPKRVRTITIRPGQAGSAPEPEAAPTIGTPPVLEPTEAASNGSANEVSPRSSVVASREPPPPVRTRRPEERAEPSSSGPLPIGPGARNDEPPPRSTGTRVASAPASGGYAVQISSQRSQGEARAAFRSLQRRFSSVLSGQQSFVRRVEIPNRGVYYRTLVGPFASLDEAGSFCSRLKAAGGQCIVQRN